MWKNKSYFNNLAKDNVANLNEFRIHNIRYIYVWILFFVFMFLFETSWTTSEIYKYIFTTIDRNNLLYLMLLFTAIFLFMFKRYYFKTACFMGSIGAAFSLIMIIFVKNAILNYLSLILLGISCSMVNVGLLFVFTFILNNTEKILAIITANLLILSISFIPYNNDGLIIYKILILIFLILALFPIYFFKKEDIRIQKIIKDNDKENINNEKREVLIQDTNIKERDIIIPARVYLFLLIGFVNSFLCIGVGNALLSINLITSEINLLTFYYLGGIIGCVIYILIVALSNSGIQLGLNSTFGFFTMALFFNVFSDVFPYYNAIFAVLLGISTTASIINNFYLIGLISKKYNSLAYLRLAFIFIFVLGGLSSIIISDYMTKYLYSLITVSTLFSLCIMISLLIISPILSDTLYTEDWVKDINKFEITPEEKDFLSSYGLTGREIEVCKLLIEGDTMRKISAKLSIAYPTVNTYCTSIYRKLNINSRTELLIRFMDNKNKSFLNQR